MKTVYRFGIVPLVVLVMFFLFPALRAQEVRNTAPTPAAGAETHKEADKDKEATAVPPEKTVATHHEITLGGKTLKYTATAGTVLIRDEEDKPYGSIFYVAYTLDGADAQTRPVSFLYNGGPGSASLWLHMGSFGPVRIMTDSPDPTAGPPYKLVANEYSLLDKSDLVFIDAPLTGYSRAVGKGTAKDFTGVDQDLRAFDRFIQRYLNVNQRWNSPKFLIGESYGTTRSAALADMLANDGVQLNGVVLISSILNYGVRAGGYDTVYISNLPSYAAAAWYFNKIPNKPADLAAWVEQARVFAAGPYAQALFAGHNLPAAQLDAVGMDVITASYPGNLYYGPSTSLPVNQAVNQAVTSTVVNAIPNPGIAGAPVAITATVTVTLGVSTPTGSVAFTDGGASLGSVALNSGTGKATINPMLALGAHSIEIGRA